jgi:hypothetical protein
MRKEKIFLWMVFFGFVAEDDEVYLNMMWTPMKLMGWWIDKLPIKLFPFEIACIVLLAIASGKSRQGRARPMLRAVYASLGGILLCVLYGMLRGGWLKACYTQAHMWMFGCIFALTASTVLTTVEHFQQLWRVVAYAAIYRSLMVVIFYLYMRGSPEMPPVMTTHQDTVLFVVGLVFLLTQALEVRSKKAIRWLLLASPLILVAMQLNNRRIAWASLAMSLAVLYWMMPKKSKALRTVNKWALILAPIAMLYVAVGWGRQEKVFKPLAAIASMGAGKVDASTKARDNENMGLMIMVQQHQLMGTGFGHQWLEVDKTYTVPETVFPMYHYLPHNNVLAMFAFTGSVGFSLLWMVFPVSVFLLCRMHRNSKVPIERSIALTGVASVVVVQNQFWGDMGFICLTPVTVVCCGVASAARLAINAGAWPAPKAKAQKAKAAAPAPAANG